MYLWKITKYSIHTLHRGTSNTVVIGAIDDARFCNSDLDRCMFTDSKFQDCIFGTTLSLTISYIFLQEQSVNLHPYDGT